jgi:hypothetical protein
MNCVYSHSYTWQYIPVTKIQTVCIVRYTIFWEVSWYTLMCTYKYCLHLHSSLEMWTVGSSKSTLTINRPSHKKKVVFLSTRYFSRKWIFLWSYITEFFQSQMLLCLHVSNTRKIVIWHMEYACKFSIILRKKRRSWKFVSPTGVHIFHVFRISFTRRSWIYININWCMIQNLIITEQNKFYSMASRRQKDTSLSRPWRRFNFRSHGWLLCWIVGKCTCDVMLLNYLDIKYVSVFSTTLLLVYYSAMSI